MDDTISRKDLRVTVTMMDPKELKPYVNNAKMHPQDQIDNLCLQISHFGFDQPITVDKDLVIITGHGRTQAAVQLGLKEVPVIVRHDLSEHDCMAKRMADNEVAKSDTDEHLIANELSILDRASYDLKYTAYDDKQIKKLLALEEVGGDELGSSNSDGGKFKQFIVSCDCDTEVIMSDLYQELKSRPGLKVTLIT